MAPSKTFLLLPHRIPASEQLLAITTTTPLSPLSSSVAPAEPLSNDLRAINSSPTTLVTVDAPGSLTVEVSNAIAFSLNLEPVLGLTMQQEQHVKYTIKSKEIKKIRLKRPGDIFCQLFEKHGLKDQLVKMLSRKAYLQGKRAYFITGIVTAVDATIEMIVKRGNGKKANAALPLDIVAGTPLPVDAGLGGGVNYNLERGSTTTSYAVGNDVWGVEYQEIKRGWWVADAARLGRPMEKVKGGMFFSGKATAENEDEEDDTWELVGDKVVYYKPTS